MTNKTGPMILADDDLYVAGGVYVQEIPSGITPKQASDGILFFDEADGVGKLESSWAVFEPNGER